MAVDLGKQACRVPSVRADHRPSRPADLGHDSSQPAQIIGIDLANRLPVTPGLSEDGLKSLLPRRAAHGFVGDDHTAPVVTVDLAGPLDDPAPPPPSSGAHLSGGVARGGTALLSRPMPGLACRVSGTGLPTMPACELVFGTSGGDSVCLLPAAGAVQFKSVAPPPLLPGGAGADPVAPSNYGRGQNIIGVFVGPTRPAIHLLEPLQTSADLPL